VYPYWVTPPTTGGNVGLAVDGQLKFRGWGSPLGTTRLQPGDPSKRVSSWLITA
jgi:hypothetical protein